MSCGNKNGNMIPVLPVDQQGQKDVVLVAGSGIAIDDLTDLSTYRFRIRRLEYTALEATLGLVAKVGGVVQSQPVLKGKVVDEVEFTFTYNKSITSQTLTNTGGLTPPTLLAADAAYEYTGQTISSNITFTLTGNDGQGQSGSIDTDQKSISFGNTMYLGFGASQIGNSPATTIAFVQALQTKVTKTSRAHTYYATGGVNQKHFVAYPKAWGLGTFTKGIFTGGYVRLKNITNVMQVEGSPETDVFIINTEGHDEEYYIYESLYDNQVDNVTPFTIS